MAIYAVFGMTETRAREEADKMITGRIPAGRRQDVVTAKAQEILKGRAVEQLTPDREAIKAARADKKALMADKGRDIHIRVYKADGKDGVKRWARYE